MKTIISTCIALVFSFVGYSQPATKTEIPKTAAGKQLETWLSVFASGKQDDYEKYIAENYSKSLLEEDNAINQADRQAKRYTDARSYEIRSIEKSTDSAIVVLTQASLTGLWFRLALKVETGKPHLIKEYSAQRIPPPPGLKKKLSEKELVQEIELFMDKLSAHDAYSGTILIAKDDKTLFKQAYGLASKAYNIPNRIDTKLSIASVGKIFTAIAIAQLVEQGKFSFTDTIGKILPDYPNKQVSGKVTIHHLLTHSSGLRDIHGAEYASKKIALRKVNDFLPLFNKDSLQFEPGDHMEYCNTGYILLGAIIESASGLDYFDYINQYIFKPAGMINSGFYEADIDIPNRATGYTNYLDIGNDYQEFHLGQWRNTSLYNGAKAGPAGGACSTVEDLLRFSQAFKSGKLVKAETIKLMTTNKIFFRKYDVNEEYYGYGFQLEIINGKRMIGHNGGDLGISTALRMYPDSGNYTIIILSNYDRGGIITVYKIQELLSQY